MKKLLLMAALRVTAAFSQGNTALLTGIITDPSGAVVPGAMVTIINVKTRLQVKTVSGQQGGYAAPSMPAGAYEVTVGKTGFKAAKKSGVEVAAGVDTTVNIALEMGQSNETVTVAAGAEIVQAISAELSSTILGRQITELPMATRNGMELFTLLAGAQTTTGFRQTFINGMPQGAINITIDGINTNDNWSKSADGFFSYIMPSLDSLEEATMTTSAAGVESTGQGGAQLKFITRTGTNQFHGGVFWQHRNTFFNSNYYFNTINRLPRDIIKLNQGGFHVGGPVLKNKLMFFVNYEIYRLPSSSSFSRAVLPPAGQAGNFSYCPTTSTAAACTANPSLLRSVNLLSMAQQANGSLPDGVRAYKTTVDPIIGSTLNQVWGLVQHGNLQNNQPGNDFNRYTYRYSPSGTLKRSFLTMRVDYNLTTTHHLSFVLKYDSSSSAPNVASGAVPIYEGTGAVLGSSVVAGQRSLPFAGTLSLRSTLSARLTNELRIGANGGTSLSSDAVTPAAFAPWRGYNPNMGYVAGVASTNSSGRSNSPVKDLAETLSWMKGRHQFSAGGNWQSVGTWSQFAAASVVPNLFLGMAAGDPATTGSTAWFTTDNFQGISAGDLSSAASMYAMLTGRVLRIGQAVVENETTHQYAHAPQVDRNRQRETGLFAQDTWRIRPNLTLTFGARFEYQFPFENLSATYTYVGLEGLWGLSGVGHLFQPGTLTGVTPTFKPVNGRDAYQTPLAVLPSVGLAYQLPASSGLMRIFTGSHTGAAVLRAGYAISSTRAGGNNFTFMWAANRGPFYSTAVDPVNFPQYFGPAGSVYFTDARLPAQPYPASPQYPITPAFTDELDDFDPHLKLAYVQSWNIGYQRELGRNTVAEVRYTGNHGVSLWRQIDFNEINIFENGFLNEAMIARQNLAIANGVTVEQLPFLATLQSVNFGNQGLPGQQNLKVLQIGLGSACCADTTAANQLARVQLGSLAASIAQNSGRLANLTAAGYPINFFQANPTVGGNGAYLMTNLGSSYYDAGQVEVRRRLSTGLQLQGSYVWAHSLIDGAFNNTSSYNLPTTLRNLRLDRTPPPYDIRHTLKANWIYEFPFGSGRKLMPSLRSALVRKALEGWEVAGTTRFQAGQPGRLTSGGGCINANECGVVLHNITIGQLQSMTGVYKTTGSNGIGALYSLPLSIIQNSEAAFNQGGFPLDPNAPYIGPQTTPGEWGYSYFLRGPWQKHLDVSLIKRTKIGERGANVEARAQALNVLNVTNFYLGGMSPNSTTFGQITSAFRDTGNANDPGGRILEFVLRVNF